MSELFIAAGCIGSFSLALVAIHLVLCALGRVFPALGDYMGEERK